MQYDLAQYGHVQTLDSEEIACEWAMNDEVVCTLVEQQPWQSLARDVAVFAGRLRGSLGFAAIDGPILI